MSSQPMSACQRCGIASYSPSTGELFVQYKELLSSRPFKSYIENFVSCLAGKARVGCGSDPMN